MKVFSPPFIGHNGSFINMEIVLHFYIRRAFSFLEEISTSFMQKILTKFFRT
jgi:hypothetical protein